MNFIKKILIFLSLICLFELFSLNGLVLAKPINSENEAQESEDSENKIGNPIDLEETKKIIDEKMPEWATKIKEWVNPAVMNAIKGVESWVSENMPAAKQEFIDDLKSLPKEFWDLAGSIWSWLLNFFKR